MYTLYIDTHSSKAIIVLYKNGQVIAIKEKTSDKSHSAVLMPLIEEIFLELNIVPKDLNEIIVVNGPGSFTGIRIGITVAKTMAFALNIALKEIDFFQVLLTSVNEKTNKQIIISDPKGYYEALFNEQNELIDNYKYLAKTDFLKKEGYVLVEESSKIDYSMVYEFSKKIKKINVHSAKPLYIKKIEVEK